MEERNEKLKKMLSEMMALLEGNEPKQPEERVESEDMQDPEDLSNEKELAKAGLIAKLRKKMPE